MEMIFEYFEYITRVASEILSSESILAVFALTISVVSVTIAGLACRFTRASFHRQILADLHKEYSSAEMHIAVATLWALRRKCEEQCEKEGEGIPEEELVKEYVRNRNDEKKTFEKKLAENAQQASDFHKSTLHFHRRLVSHFYQHLSTLYVNRMLPKDYIYDRWHRADLKILPDIIIPIENWLRENIHKPPEPRLPDQHPLWRLYDGAPCPLEESP